MNKNKLVLFYRPTCPYCQKVLGFMKQKNILLELKDISNNAQWIEELISQGGKRQVPCLFIDGKALYESADIIQWLDRHYPAQA